VIKTSELRSKDVINLVDGRRLGFVGDLDLDVEGGQIRAFVIQGANRWLGWLGKDRDTVVPWGQVEKIGEDVILVRIDNYSEAAVR
jgi:YlmC/YmxH family sporulation protein